jgi:hypothetical protein
MVFRKSKIIHLKFVTEPYTAQDICRVLRYEGGQICQNSRYVICERSLK